MPAVGASIATNSMRPHIPNRALVADTSNLKMMLVIPQASIILTGADALDFGTLLLILSIQIIQSLLIKEGSLNHMGTLIMM